MKIKNKSWFLSIGIGVCILLLAIICLVIQKTEKSRGEEADFADQFTNSEEEKMYNYMEKQLAPILSLSAAMARGSTPNRVSIRASRHTGRPITL